MSGRFRTPAGGTRIERATPVRFTFDGRSYLGLAGDTLASALLAHGVHLVARSVKYHRPRGILTAGSDEPSALVTVRRDAARSTPNLRATQVELYEGLCAVSQNCWPSLRFDIGVLADPLAPLLPASFPYQSAMWPRRAWLRLCERWLRAAAGLGSAARQPDPDRYTQRHAHCELLVIGAGPAGIAAAHAAAASGARVILCDEQAELGGSLLGQRDEHIGAEPVLAWRERMLADLSAAAHVTLLPRTSAFGYLPHNSVALIEHLTDHLADPHPDTPRERLWQVRAKEVVLATGSTERPLVFPGNDRPGILLAGAARTYLNRYGVRCGRRALLLTGCDEGYRAALDLAAAGVEIALIADVREEARGPLADAARAAGLCVEARMRVLGTHGRLRVRSVSLARLSPSGEAASVSTVACDVVLMSGGYTPSVHLFSQSRGTLNWDENLGVFVPGRATERVRCAGACRGLFDLAQVVEDGLHAGAAAARDTSGSPAWRPAHALTAAVGNAFGTSGGTSGSTALVPVAAAPARQQAAAALRTRQPAFVDWHSDVTSADLAFAAGEGFGPIEHITLNTAAPPGGAPEHEPEHEQNPPLNTSGPLNAISALEAQISASVPQAGASSWRLPCTPVSFGSFAGLARGELFAPARRTPLYSWASRHGAVFEDACSWQRPRCYPRSGEDLRAAVSRECLAVRRGCGIFDASPQGRIEVSGPDALAFLERLYINSLADLSVGSCRYALLLAEDGFIQDDGIVARVAPDRFHITTAIGSESRVLELMEEYRQGVWRDLALWVTPTTDAWAVIAVQGPLSRRVLQELVEDADLSAAGLPHMNVVCGRIGAVPTLVLRVSFTGELGFEVRVPADYGEAVWEAILEAGRAHGGVTPYGSDAMSVLRTEKGYLLLGQDTDSLTIPEDVGLGWPIGDGKPDFVGKRALQRPAMSAPDRPQLVGLLPLDPRVTLEEGSQVIRRRGSRPPVRALGHVTSSCHSPTLGRSIALALLSGGRSRIGQILHVPGPEGSAVVEVTWPVFYDPEGNRLHG